MGQEDVAAAVGELDERLPPAVGELVVGDQPPAITSSAISVISSSLLRT